MDSVGIQLKDKSVSEVGWEKWEGDGGRIREGMK